MLIQRESLAQHITIQVKNITLTVLVQHGEKIEVKGFQLIISQK